MICYTDKHRIPFQIDEDDYEAVSRYYWYVDHYGYPGTSIGKWPDPRRRVISLHVFLLGMRDGLEIDHINRDKLDNRRANLRFVTRRVNSRNVGPRATNTSGVVGVHWDRHNQKWRVQIRVGHATHSFGRFPTIDAAIEARRKAEDRFWGEER